MQFNKDYNVDNHNKVSEKHHLTFYKDIIKKRIDLISGKPDNSNFINKKIEEIIKTNKKRINRNIVKHDIIDVNKLQEDNKNELKDENINTNRVNYANDVKLKKNKSNKRESRLKSKIFYNSTLDVTKSNNDKLADLISLNSKSTFIFKDQNINTITSINKNNNDENNDYINVKDTIIVSLIDKNEMNTIESNKNICETNLKVYKSAIENVKIKSYNYFDKFEDNSQDKSNEKCKVELNDFLKKSNLLSKKKDIKKLIEKSEKIVDMYAKHLSSFKRKKLCNFIVKNNVKIINEKNEKIEKENISKHISRFNQKIIKDDHSKSEYDKINSFKENINLEHNEGKKENRENCQIFTKHQKCNSNFENNNYKDILKEIKTNNQILLVSEKKIIAKKFDILKIVKENDSINFKSGLFSSKNNKSKINIKSGCFDLPFIS